MLPSHVTPELLARTDYAARSADKHAQVVRKLAGLKLPPGFTVSAVQSHVRAVETLPVDPVSLELFRQAAERTRPFLDQARATMARRPPMPEAFPEPEHRDGR